MDIAANMKAFFSGNKPVQSPPPAPAGTSLDGTGKNVDAHNKAIENVQHADPGKPAAPLASFEKLWETDPNKQVSKPSGVLPEITAEQLTTTLANSNFLSSVPQELLAKAASGDATAFGEVINQGLRTVMAQSVLASRGLVEAGARNQGERLKTELPTMVRSSNVSDSLHANPLYSNPAVKPIIDNVRRQLEEKNPTATAKEIAEMTDTYFSHLIAAFKGDDSGRSSAEPAHGTDINWFKEIGLE